MKNPQSNETTKKSKPFDGILPLYIALALNFAVGCLFIVLAILILLASLSSPSRNFPALLAFSTFVSPACIFFAAIAVLASCIYRKQFKLSPYQKRLKFYLIAGLILSLLPVVYVILALIIVALGL